MQKWMYALMANVGTYVWAPSVDRGWPQHHFMPRSASFLSFLVPILQSLDSLYVRGRNGGGRSGKWKKTKRTIMESAAVG